MTRRARYRRAFARWLYRKAHQLDGSVPLGSVTVLRTTVTKDDVHAVSLAFLTGVSGVDPYVSPTDSRFRPTVTA